MKKGSLSLFLILFSIPSFAVGIEDLYDFMYEHRIKYPHVVVAQSILETGYGTSGLYLKTNNLFGMKNPVIRQTTSIGSCNGYAVYKNESASVLDYKHRVIEFQGDTCTSFYSYLNFLNDSHYAEDGVYVKKVYKIAVELFIEDVKDGTYIKTEYLK